MANNSRDKKVRNQRLLGRDRFLVRDAKDVEKLFRKAVAEALRIHRALDNTVAVMQEGRMVLIKP